MILLYIILAVVFWGVGPVMDKVALVKLDPLLGVFIRAATTTLVLLGFLGASGRMSGVGSVDSRSVLLIVVSGIFASLLGQWAYFKALQVGAASQVVPLCATYPLVAVGLSALLLKERITVEKLLGVVLVIAGIWLVKK